MPVTSGLPPAPYQVNPSHPSNRPKSNIHRSQSLRSELSNNSQQSKRVSFNRDVHIKRIPRGVEADPNGKLVAVLRSPGLQHPRLWVNDAESAPNPTALYNEAQSVLKLVENLSCSVAVTPHHQDQQYFSLGRPPKKSTTTLQRSPSKLSEFFRPKKKSRSPSSVGDSLTSLGPLGGSLVEFPMVNGGGESENPTTRNYRPSSQSRTRATTTTSRSGLNSIGETPTNSSGSDDKDVNNTGKIHQETSDSPISSLSGPEDGMNNNGNILRRYDVPPPMANPRLRKSLTTTTTPPERPPPPKFNFHSNEASHFPVQSRLERSHSTIVESRPSRNSSPIIYAQVVVSSEPRNGVLTKKTIHRFVSSQPEGRTQRVGINGNSSTSAVSGHPSPIAHAHSPGYTNFKSQRPNVTTLVINNGNSEDLDADLEEDGEQIQRGRIQMENQNGHFDRKSEEKSERPFFYGDSISRSLRQMNLNSSYPYYQHHVQAVDPNSNSTRLVRDVNRTVTIDPDYDEHEYEPSAKIVTSFGNDHDRDPVTVTELNYKIANGERKMNGTGTAENVNYLNRLNNGISKSELKLRNGNGKSEVSLRNGIPKSQAQVNGHVKSFSKGIGSSRPVKLSNGISKSELKLNGHVSSTPYEADSDKNGFLSNHSNSLEIIYKKNHSHSKEDEVKTKERNPIISTLMRRSSKKAQHPPQRSPRTEIPTHESTTTTTPKQKTKFLAGFLEKNFTLRRNGKLAFDDGSTASGNPGSTTTLSKKTPVSCKRNGALHS